MIAEQLLRSGQAFVEGVGSTSILLQVISDSIDKGVRNYWQRVIIVEIDPAEEQVEVQPIQSWGNWHALEGRRKQLFFPDHRAAFAPVFMPKGGNPLAPQGHYGPPVYPVWERHWRSFADSADGVHRFLEPRLERTIGVDLSKRMRRQIYQAVHEAIRGYEPEGKPLAVLILAVTEEGSDFSFSIEGGDDGQIAKSSLYPERFLCVNAEMMLQHVWEAKEKEGAEKGRLEHGVCAFTGKRGVVISGDNKAWPWFTTTWEAPFPETFKETDHVKRMAFSPEAYRFLTVGAALFGSLSKALDFNLNRQLFAPVDSARGRETERRGQLKTTIYGSSIVTPLLDAANLDDGDKQLFAYGMQQRVQGKRRGADLLLSNLLGYEAILPEELTKDQFRLTSLYFSGNPSRAEIYLHATIEEVLPSVLKSVGEVMDEVFSWSSFLFSERQAWLHQRTRSLPYLLVAAYGPAFLWQNLGTVLHAESLPWAPFTRGAAHRCSELAHNLLDTKRELRDEAAFYATFRHFYSLYHRVFQTEEREMRPWQELVHNITEGPIEQVRFQGVEELGFAAGYLVRRFASQYYAATDQKEYLQHRVMTFGSDLKPEVVYRKALGRLPEYAMRVDAHLSEDFRRRLGVWLSAYPHMEAEVTKHPDEFIAAFWAGYMLGKVE